MIRILLSFAALWVAASTPFAVAQAPAGTTRVDLRLLAFAPPQDSGELFVHDPAAKDDAVGVAVRLKSYLNHENHTLVLLARELVFSASAQRTSLTQPGAQLARVTLPAGKRELILLFLPRTQDSGVGWQVLPIDDSVRGFPPGSIQILNLSASPVRIQLQETDFDFKSGESKLIADPPVGRNQHSAMTAHAFVEGEWRRIGAGLWPHPGRKRTVQVLFDEPASGQVQLRGFRDVVEKNVPAAPKP
jgi:hypothetical protein